MSLNKYELSLFTKEFKELLPLKIEKLYIPEENILILTLYKNNFKKHLQIEVGSDYSGLYFVKERPQQNLVANIQNKFRNLLLNGLLRDISQINNDRILELIIDVKDQTYKLILELTGRYGNIFIVNDENIIESILLMNKKDKRRELGLNLVYQYPLGRHSDLLILDESLPIRDGGFLEYLEDVYSLEVIEKKRKRLEDAYLRVINKKKKKLKNKKKKLALDLEKLNSYKENKKIGELIKANLYQIKRGMDSVSVIDYYDANMKKVNISLKKDKTPIENMEIYFKKYEKYSRGVVFIQKELKRVEKTINELLIQPVMRANPRIRPHDIIANDKKKHSTHTPYKTYMSSKGFKILVGKRSTDNDFLTFKVASGNDIWLHVISYSGSHVVIKKNNKKDVIDINSIYEAAHLAILNSKAPDNDSVEVCYTFRKYVKKPPKSKPGAVIYTMEKRLYLELDPNIIDRLKED